MCVFPLYEGSTPVLINLVEISISKNTWFEDYKHSLCDQFVHVTVCVSVIIQFTLLAHNIVCISESYIGSICTKNSLRKLFSLHGAT